MLKALVSGIAVFRGGAWRKGLDHKGSDFTDGLIPGRFIARRHCWEIMEAQEAGLGGGSRSLEALKGVYCPTPSSV